jgi:hypothetical protein
MDEVQKKSNSSVHSIYYIQVDLKMYSASNVTTKHSNALDLYSVNRSGERSMPSVAALLPPFVTQ